jgi:hypothetical protein
MSTPTSPFQLSVVMSHLELRKVINFVGRLTVLCFTASSAVHAWEFVYDLPAMSGSYQLH